MLIPRWNISLLICCLNLYLVFASFSDALAEVKPEDICSKKEMRIGVAVDDPDRIPQKMEVLHDGNAKIKPETGFPPFLIPLYKDGGAVYAVGYDIDLIHLIAQNFCPVDRNSPGPKPYPEPKLYYDRFDKLFDRLRLKQLDFLVAAISADVPSDARRGILYSIPYHENGGEVLLVPKCRPDDGCKTDERKLKDCKAALHAEPPAQRCQTALQSGPSGTSTRERLAWCLFNQNVYFLGDTLGKEKLSYSTGIDPVTLEKCSVTPNNSDRIQDMLDAAIKAKGIILLDEAMARFYMNSWNAGNTAYRERLKDWELFQVKTNLTGTSGPDKYLLTKSGEVVATREEDAKLMTRINQILNEARMQNVLERDLEDTWFEQKGTLASFVTTSVARLDSAADLRGASKSISFSFTFAVPVSDTDSGNTVGGTLEFSSQSVDQKELGVAVAVSEKPIINEGAMIALERRAQFGPFYRWHSPYKTQFFSEPWIGFHLDGIYIDSFKDDKSANTFTKDKRTILSLIPEAGWFIPFSDKVKIKVAFKLIDVLITKGHPEPTLQLDAGFTVPVP